MKKLLSLLAVIGTIGILSGVGFARLIPLNGNAYNQTTNPPTNDLWCNGGQIAGNTVKSYTEVCQDYLGDWLPTSTSGTQSLGTSSLPWLNTYSTTLTAGSGGLVNATGPVQLAINTTTQLTLRADPVGSEFLVQESTGGIAFNLVSNTYNTCVSTKQAVGSYVYIAVSTNTNTAKVGTGCNN